MENTILNKNNKSAIAALIPAWNPREGLMKTLASIASQAVECEIFVVDDGSQPAIKLPAQMGDKPIHVIRLDKNLGITAALNTGLKIILEQPFEFISRHDCGDIDHQDRLKKQLAYLRQNKDVMLIGSSVNFKTPFQELQYVFEAPETHAQVKQRMRYSPAIIHSSCMFRASAFKEIGLYSETYPYAEDYDLFLRFLAKYEIRNLSDVLVTAQYSADSISMYNRRASLTSRLKLQLNSFDSHCIHSYLGILQTFGLWVVPYRFVSLIKSSSFPIHKKQHDSGFSL